MLSRSEICAVQPSTSRARLGSATSEAGSPARRPTSRRGILWPVTRSAASITALTLCPAPERGIENEGDEMRLRIVRLADLAGGIRPGGIEIAERRIGETVGEPVPMERPLDH